jgi:hypothetical protein
VRSGRAAISIDELKDMLADRVKLLAPELLPNGHKELGHWRTGNVADEPGQSLIVYLHGPKAGRWFDYSANEGGNLFQLIAQVKFGGDGKSAWQWARSWLGLDDLDPARLATERARAAARSQDRDRQADADREARRRKALGLFLAGGPIGGTPVELYLQGRGIDLRALGRAPNSIAWHPEVWNGEARRKLPCMLAAVVDLEGRHIATHRTWLAPDGRGGWRKADVDQPKMALGGFGGGFIPLWKGSCPRPMASIAAGTRVHVSEGIEDGLTVACARPELRVISAISLGNIGAVRLPPQAGDLVVIAQRDAPGSPALDALEAAIARQQEQAEAQADPETGEVRMVRLVTPPAGFKDVNEVLTGRAA